MAGCLAPLRAVVDARTAGCLALLRVVVDARTVDFVALRAAVDERPADFVAPAALVKRCAVDGLASAALFVDTFAPARRESFFFAMRLTRHHGTQRFAAEQMQM
jgi:hypothetical protein